MKMLIRNFLIFIMPQKIYVHIRYLFSHNRFLNLKSPQSFTEKIQYRKLFKDPVLYSRFADKFTARTYVSELIGSEYLIPLLYSGDTVTLKDLDLMPESFVIKTSHGGGGNSVFLISNKSKCNLRQVVKKINEMLLKKMGKYVHEFFYDIEKPKVIIEKLMLDNDGNIPLDYKFHVFNQTVEFIQVDKRVNGVHYMSIYDSKFNLLNKKLNSKLKPIPHTVKIPNKFYLMKDLACKLGSGFGYVRVDLYSLESKVYFGEMTFCPSSGWSKVYPQEWDYKLGSLWDIDNLN